MRTTVAPGLSAVYADDVVQAIIRNKFHYVVNEFIELVQLDSVSYGTDDDAIAVKSGARLLNRSCTQAL